MNWTFGIITSRNTNQYIDTIIESIEQQSTNDDYEIVVVGEYNGRGGPRVTRIEYDEGSDIQNGKITIKKNIISRVAKYEHLAILHDYVSFDKDWMLYNNEFGDDWDVLMTQILNYDNSRFRDWVTWLEGYCIPKDNNCIRQVPYEDTSYIRKQYISGTYFCIKKSFMLQHPMNESLGWGNGEDIEYSVRLRDFWNYKMNPKSIVRLLKEKYHDPVHKQSIYSLITK